MLVLSRHKNETIIIGNNITISVIEIRGDKVRLGVDAPKEISVHRQEVYDAIKRKENLPKQILLTKLVESKRDGTIFYRGETLVRRAGSDEYYRPGDSYSSPYLDHNEINPPTVLDYTPERLLQEKIDSHREPDTET